MPTPLEQMSDDELRALSQATQPQPQGGGGPLFSGSGFADAMRIINGPPPPGPAVEAGSGLPGGGGQEISASTRGPPQAMDRSFAGSVPNWISAAASLAVRPEDELAIYARLTGIPRSRWGRVDGAAVYVDEGGRLHRAVSDVSQSTGVGDALMRGSQWVGSGIGPAIPQAVGAIAALPFGGPVGQSLGAAIGGGVGDFARQQASNAILGRSPGNVETGNILGHALLAGGGQAIGNLAARGLERNRLAITGMEDRGAITNPANLAQWRGEAANAANLGIPLRPDQITNLPSMRQTARQLTREPEATNTMQLFQRAQQGEAVPNALAAEIPAIAPTQGGGAPRFIEGARDTIRQAERTRTAASSPHYQAAIGDTIQPGSVTANYRPSAASFDQDSPIAAVINRYADRIEGAQNAAQLDGIYREIRDAARAAAQDNPTLSHHLGNLRDTLNAQLTGAPGIPAISPNIAAGRQAHIAASPPINEMERGIVGMARGLENQPVMVQRENVASILSRGNADEIRAARGAYERAGNLDAWNAGAQDWLRGASDTAQRVRIEGNMPGNVAGRFLQEAAPTPMQGQATAEILGGAGSAEAQRFGRLAQALRAASNTVQEGSPTVTDAIGRQRFAGPLARAISNTVKSVSPSRLSNMITEGSISRNAPRIAEAYTNANPMQMIENAGVLTPAQFHATQAGGQAGTVAINRLIQDYLRGRLPNQIPVGAEGGQ